MATHLTELRDPLLGHDPQFGKRCRRWQLFRPICCLQKVPYPKMLWRFQEAGLQWADHGREESLQS